MVQLVAIFVSNNGEESAFKVMINKTKRGKLAFEALSKNTSLKVERFKKGTFRKNENFKVYMAKAHEAQKALHGEATNIYPHYAEK